MSFKVCSLLGVSAGDIAFFMRRPVEEQLFESAVVAVSQQNVFHVGLFCCNGCKIVHALPKCGVIVEEVDNAVDRLNANSVEIYSVETDCTTRAKAAEWALSQVGSNYNDLFSSSCTDSLGNKAYYCCQLIVKAYENCGLPSICPSHKLNFRDGDGKLIPYWDHYFKSRNFRIPQGEPGSHPGKLIQSDYLRLRFKTVDRMGRFSVSKNLSSALHFIRGCRVSPETLHTFKVFEPRSGNLLAECAIADSKLIDLVVKDAKLAQPLWMNLGPQQRGNVLRKAASIIRDEIEDLSYMETLDCGKPLYESKMDMNACADTFEFFSGVSHNLAGSHFSLSSGQHAYTERLPWGVVGAIGVWNYPMQTASWKIAPALICGNAVVYKPSELAPVTAVLLAEILHHAGLPEGILSVLQGDGSVGKAICDHIDVNKITFTGSTLTGAKVYSSCSKEGNLKPVTLELGGKSACIICDDANLEMSVTGAMMANFFCQGEVCSNASKILVHESIYKEFRERVVDATRKIVIGDPLKEETRCGATISKQHLQKVKRFIEEAVSEGAKVLCGGEEVEVEGLPNGFYLAPAVLENVNEEMRIYKEEVFGAVMLLIPFSSLEEAIRMANDTPYGLANGVFTRDMATAYSVASRLQAGNIYVNTFNDINAMVPFGGMKQSGFGRENGVAAIEAFSQIKSVFVNASNSLGNPFAS